MVEPLCERAAAFIRLMILLPQLASKEDGRPGTPGAAGFWIENAQAQRDS